MSDWKKEQALENLKKYFEKPHPLEVVDVDKRPAWCCRRCGETVSVFYWPLTFGANDVHICDRCFMSFRKWWDRPHKDVEE